MKLFVQVPCLNEEDTLPLVLESIPREIPGIDSVEILVIDDGSSDRTDRGRPGRTASRDFVHHTRTWAWRGRSATASTSALAHGADIVVNTDGDNQYPQERIADLVQPLVRGEADIAIGDRQTATIAHFSPFKIGSCRRSASEVVNKAAGTDLPDAASGFRAYSKQSLIRLNVVTQFSYCMETIIQAATSAADRLGPHHDEREDPRVPALQEHLSPHDEVGPRDHPELPHVQAAYTVGGLGILLSVAALIPFIRFAVLWLMGDAGGHIQSLIFGTAMLMGALLSFALLVIAATSNGRTGCCSRTRSNGSRRSSTPGPGTRPTRARRARAGRAAPGSPGTTRPTAPAPRPGSSPGAAGPAAAKAAAQTSSRPARENRSA